MQCLYCSFVTEQGAGTARKLYAQWTEPSDTHVETLDVSEEEATHLNWFLEQSTGLLPPPHRILNGLPLGFLPA